jgi:hypothetical protein
MQPPGLTCFTSLKLSRVPTKALPAAAIRVHQTPKTTLTFTMSVL